MLRPKLPDPIQVVFPENPFSLAAPTHLPPRPNWDTDSALASMKAVQDRLDAAGIDMPRYLYPIARRVTDAFQTKNAAAVAAACQDLLRALEYQ